MKDISVLVASFSEADTAGKRSLVQLLASDAHTFCCAAIRVLSKTAPSAGARFLIYLLSKEKLLTTGLVDEGACTLKDAVAAAKTIDDTGLRIQPALEMALSRTLKVRGTPESASQVMRILELLGAISSQNSWPSFQSELMVHADVAVRSKAALLIERSLRNRAWINRRMMDKDARVQANAVEALWTMDPAEARPVFMAALRSQNNRVIANAALGLYRLSDLKAVRPLLDLAQHSDPLFRASGLWAIAETEDPRFIPFLMDQFKTAQGKIKLAITRSLARIRRREKARAEKGTVLIHVSNRKAEPDGRRQIEFALSCSGGDEITSLKPTEFALWEGGTLIEHYEVKLPNNPAALVIGIAAPRFISDSDPYQDAVGMSLKRSLPLKRPDDWWRIDRYAIEALAADPNAPVEKSTLPYSEALITQEVKGRQGFVADPVHLEKVISLPVPRDRATTDVLAALRRQIDAMDKSSGKRYLFVFVHQTSVDALDDPENLNPLRELIQKEAISLCGFCPDGSEKCPGFRDLCLSTPNGAFHSGAVDKVADEFELTYRQLLNRYEIRYSMPPKTNPAEVTLQVWSEYGAGRAQFSLV